MHSRKYLLNRTSDGVRVGEVRFGEGDAGGFAGFAGGGWQDADVDEVDADAGEFGVGGRAPGVPSVGSPRSLSVDALCSFRPSGIPLGAG